jgi:hypothetical protein
MRPDKLPIQDRLEKTYISQPVVKYQTLVLKSGGDSTAAVGWKTILLDRY